MPLFVSRFILQPLLREAVTLFSAPAVNNLLLSQYYYALFFKTAVGGLGSTVTSLQLGSLIQWQKRLRASETGGED